MTGACSEVVKAARTTSDVALKRLRAKIEQLVVKRDLLAKASAD